MPCPKCFASDIKSIFTHERFASDNFYFVMPCVHVSRMLALPDLLHLLCRTLRSHTLTHKLSGGGRSEMKRRREETRQVLLLNLVSYSCTPFYRHSQSMYRVWLQCNAAFTITCYCYNYCYHAAI